MTPKKFLVLAAVSASLAANVYMAWLLKPTWFGASPASSAERIVVMRTPGGLLQVSTIESPEVFLTTQNHTIFGIPVGRTTSQIRAPATFHYHIELAPEWKITVRGKAITVIAPRVKPTLPVAVDTARLEKLTSGAWSLFTGNAELDALQKSISQALAAKASSPQFIELQREAARKTVTEFVAKWVLEQKSWKPSAGYSVRVFFADEPIEVLEKTPPRMAWQ